MLKTRLPEERKSCSSSTRAKRAVLRRKYLELLGPVEPFRQIFDHLPGIYFCMKDTQSRLMCGNQALLERLNVACEDDLSGTDDYEYFPAHIADSFIADDQMVMSTGQPLLGHVAVWYNQQGMPDWFVKNKFPLRDRAGKIVGLINVIYSYEGMRDLHTPFAEVSRIIDYIRCHIRERIKVEDLAILNGISPRHLHRKFQIAFGLNVQQFLMKTRIQAAQDALIRTNHGISEIALDFGFCDQSAFTRQFREHTGLTPLRFRKKHTLLPADSPTDKIPM